jgi:hypothetical protein
VRRELKAEEGWRRSESECEERAEWRTADPKPGELSMARLQGA